MALKVPTRLVLLAFMGAATALAHPGATDTYSQAVTHAGRSADDLKRDLIDRPAEVLRLSGISRGMRVADFFAADGYYSELVSYVVGPKGRVYLLNNATWDRWSEGHWKERIEGRLANVEHRTIDAEHLDLPDHSLDAVLMMKVYHDLY